MSTSLIPLLVFGVPGIIFLLVGLGFIVYRGLLSMPPKDEAFIQAWCRERGDLVDEDLELPWIVERVPSPQSYDIVVHALEGEGGGLVLLQHGITWSWLGMMRYVRVFRAAGWTVVALDSRGHGETKGPRPSYGWHERHDLKAVADWALARFGRAARGSPGAAGSSGAAGSPGAAGGGGLFAVLGVSMGAASVLQYAALDPRLDAVIADCPFSSLAAELDHRLRRAMLPFFARPAIVRIADAFCRAREGFSLYGIRPDRAMLQTEVPMLFVHGLEDDYVPWKMSLTMAERRRRELPEAFTELRLVPEAKHARSIAVDPEGYALALAEFLDRAAERKAAAGAS
ncbi:MAG: alpha/beta fold hydrolase [Treponema sp.]|nr:alpha/beta fold hydrolase [Treponema sp.]